MAGESVSKAIEACAKVVDAATKSCVSPTAALPPPPPPASVPSPDFDALAASIAAQSSSIAAQANYLTWGSMIFAAAALVAAVAWGIVVKIWAEKSARDAVEQWMDRNAPGEIAKVLADILPSQVDGGPEPSPRPAVSQEDQEEALGEEPA